MNWFEKKFGKYAIRNITLILIMCYVVGYVVRLFNPEIMFYLTLDPYQILHGQVWRLVTWLLIPPSSLDPFTLLMLYVYYNLGTTLERTWGTFRYNVFLFSGMLFTILGSFLCMGFTYAFMPNYANEMNFLINSLAFSTYYVNMSIFLAFAITYPDAQVLFMFIIPVKVKWMGILDVIWLVYTFVMTGSIAVRFAIAASLLNVVVFYFSTRSWFHMRPQQIKRRAEFKQQVKRSNKITRHKCAICGQTEEDDAGLEFRFCSKCNGNYEYCQNHLFTHEHVK